MSRNFTKAKIVSAVSNSRGIVSVVARSLGCDWKTARKYIDLHPDAQAIEQSEREVLCDQAESVVVGLMKADDSRVKFNAATYILDRLAKKRGYTTKTEIDHTTAGESLNSAPNKEAVKKARDAILNGAEIED